MENINIHVNPEGEEYEVEELLAWQYRNGGFIYLTKWVGYSDMDSSWQPRDSLINCEDAITVCHLKYPILSVEEIIAHKWLNEYTIQYLIRLKYSGEVLWKSWYYLHCKELIETYQNSVVNHQDRLARYENDEHKPGRQVRR